MSILSNNISKMSILSRKKWLYCHEKIFQTRLYYQKTSQTCPYCKKKVSKNVNTVKSMSKMSVLSKTIKKMSILSWKCIVLCCSQTVMRQQYLDACVSQCVVAVTQCVVAVTQCVVVVTHVCVGDNSTLIVSSKLAEAHSPPCRLDVILVTDCVRGVATLFQPKNKAVCV
jgi:hypothetical protein